MGRTMQYDVASKRLVELGKESLLNWLLGIEPSSVELIEELPEETVSLRSSDFPLLVRYESGEKQIVLLEFQTRWENELPLRLMDYAVRFKLRYSLPVKPVVLLFRESSAARESYDDGVMSIRYMPP